MLMVNVLCSTGYSVSQSEFPVYGIKRNSWLESLLCESTKRWSKPYGRSLRSLFEPLVWRIRQLRCVHKVALTIPQTLVPANMHLVRYIGD